MEVDAPYVEDASIWKLLKLKKGQKSLLSKSLKELHKSEQPIESVNVVEDAKRKRRTAYISNKSYMHLWKGPVHRNRLAEHLIFPLDKNDVSVVDSAASKELKEKSYVNSAKKSKTIVGNLYSKLYHDESIVLNEQQKRESEQIKIALEIADRLEQQAKQKLRESYLAEKLKRKKKIKSKSFHRHLKKRTIKEFEKEMDFLRENEPQKFVQRLAEAERERIQERATLRHKTGSKFAKNQRLRAKYDKEARDAVASMRDIGRELTKKHAASDDESDESGMELSSSESECTESDWESENEEQVPSKSLTSLTWWRNAQNNKVAEKSDETKANLRKPIILGTLDAPESMLKLVVGTATKTTTSKCEKDNQSTDVVAASSGSVHHSLTPAVNDDGDDFFAALEEVCGVEVGDDSPEARFAAERAAVEGEEAPTDLDGFLPGWNRWTGPSEKLQERDRKLRENMLVKAPRVKRRDASNKRAYIRQKINSNVKQHMVKTIPYPFNTVPDVEKHLQQPVSREWTTEAGHRELTRPRISVQAGQIIRPLNKSAALIRDKDFKRLTLKRKNVV